MLGGLALICVASISWGTTGATMTLLARDSTAGPLLVGWARMAVAAPLLVLATVLAGRRPCAVAPRSLPAWRDGTAGASLLLGAAMALYQVCYFWAVTLTGVAVTALLAICSAPLMIAIFAAMFLHERLTVPVGLALVMAVTGTALLVVGPRGFAEVAGHFALGALLALGAGLSYAVYTVTAKGLLARMAPFTVSAVTFTLAALFLSPTLLGGGPVWEPLVAGWPLFLYLGVGPTAVAYLLFTAGLSRVPTTVAGIVSLLEPLTATTLGVLWFREVLGPAGWTGAVLVVAALVVLVAARRQAA